MSFWSDLGSYWRMEGVRRRCVKGVGALLCVYVFVCGAVVVVGRRREQFMVLEGNGAVK